MTDTTTTALDPRFGEPQHEARIDQAATYFAGGIAGDTWGGALDSVDRFDALAYDLRLAPLDREIGATEAEIEALCNVIDHRLRCADDLSSLFAGGTPTEFGIDDIAGGGIGWATDDLTIAPDRFA